MGYITFKDLSLSGKIFLGFAFLLVLFSAVSGWTVWTLQSVQKETMTVSTTNMPALQAAGRIEALANEVLGGTNRFGFTLDLKDSDAVTSKLAELKQAISKVKTLGAYESIKEFRTNIDEVEKLTANFETAFAAFGDSISNMNESRQTMEDTEESFLKYVGRVVKIQNELLFTGRAATVSAEDWKDELEKIKRRLVICDESTILAIKAARMATQGYAQRSTSKIEAAVKEFETIEKQFDELLAITPVQRKWEPARDVGLARKDDVSNARAQAGVFKMFVSYFLNAWKEMEKSKTICVGSIEQLQALSKTVASNSVTQASDSASSAASVVDFIVRWTMIAAVALFVIGSCSAFGITRIITRSINTIVMGIANSLSQKTAETLKTSKKFARAGEQLAMQAAAQAASIEETSASLVQLSATTKSNAEKAALAKDIANDTRLAAEAGEQSVHHMNRSVTAVQEAGQQLVTAMDSLRTFSQDISQIIKNIDEISFQTNILALNASIEAAHAGVHGAGFAVVAEEVRNLAQRSAEASRETGERVEQAIKRCEEGATVSEVVLARVKEILSSSKQVDSQLGGILERARRVDEMMNEIAAASAEQNNGIAAINNTVQHMDITTQENAATASQTAEAAQLLQEQAAAVRVSVLELIEMVKGSDGAQDHLIGEDDVEVGQAINPVAREEELRKTRAILKKVTDSSALIQNNTLKVSQEQSGSIHSPSKKSGVNGHPAFNLAERTTGIPMPTMAKKVDSFEFEES